MIYSIHCILDSYFHPSLTWPVYYDTIANTTMDPCLDFLLALCTN